MAQVGPTNDTYQSVIAKVLNHLSLGVINIRGGTEFERAPVSGDLVVEKPVENFDVDRGEDAARVTQEGELGDSEQAVFDGYVAESTELRVKLTEAAFTVWKKDLTTMMFGVGLGGAGQAMYVNGLSSSPKEIVQNEYVSLLLETGLVGLAMFVLTLVLIVRGVWKSGARMAILSLLVAYGVTLMFFAGLPNALQIYLLPMVLCALTFSKQK